MGHDLDKFFWRKINGKWKRYNKKLVLTKCNGYSKASYIMPNSSKNKKREGLENFGTDLSSFSLNKTPIETDTLSIYIDGSCLKKDNTCTSGVGGFGLLAIDSNKEVLFEQSGGIEVSTNARMEVYALLKALQYLEDNEYKSCVIKSDSDYVVNTINKGWLFNWYSENYKVKTTQLRANKDYWEAIRVLYLKHKDKVTIEWVKAHSGEEFNEKVDKLAQAAAKSIKSKKTSKA